MALRLSGLASGMDTESIVTELMKAQRLKSTKIENKITLMEWKQDKWKNLNKKIFSLYTDKLAKLKMQGSFNTKKVTSSDESKVTVSANTASTDGSHTLKISQLASSQFVTGKAIASATPVTSATTLASLGVTTSESTANTVTITGSKAVTLTLSDTTTVGEFTQAFKDAGLNASYDETQKRFFISSKESGTANAFSVTSTGTTDLSKLGLNQMTKDTAGVVSIVGTSNISLVQPKDAKVNYNGADLISSTNTFTANGLTFTLKDTTETGEEISLSVSKDTQAVYDMVKGFVKSYNELMTEMNESFYAASAKGYNPLTDEEKEAMSETQIEQWDDKIKASLLRRDDNLSTVMNTLRTSLSRSITVDGKSYSLSTFGIGTTGYTEKGILHIDGDVDDSILSGKTNDLMNALTEDPDTVMKVFNGLADKLYSSLTKSMSSTSLRSALTLYNDKDMTKSITNYKEDLDVLEEKLQDMEDRYYKQFSAMETAMAKMNSQSSSLASMLGTG